MEQTPQRQPGTPPEEKLEFLRREEVRTMAKDIAKLRKQEAAKERERIAGIRQGEQYERPQVVLSQQSSQNQEQMPSQPLSPGRSLSPFEKTFVRIAVIIILLFLIFNIVAFGFWFFFARTGGL